MILRVLDAICVAGSNKNEDRVGFGKDFIFVIDGATGLRGINIMGERSDAEWFSRRLAEELQVYLNYDELEIEDILHRALATIRNEYSVALSRHPGVCPDYPSCGLVIFRERNGYLESYRLGDCLGIIRYKSGKVLLMKEKNLVALDKYAISCQVAIAKRNGISVADARPLINDVLIANRNKLNKPGGYWILEPSGIGIGHGEHRKFNPKLIDSISCTSDGYFAIVETYKIMKNYNDFQTALVNGKCADLTRRMFEAQESDIYFNKYPRFKFRDDASAVIGKIY